MATDDDIEESIQQQRWLMRLTLVVIALGMTSLALTIGLGVQTMINRERIEQIKALELRVKVLESKE